MLRAYKTKELRGVVLVIKYQQEFVAQVEDEIEALLLEDWEEIEHNKDLNKLSPDWEMYSKLEELGILYIFTCRDGEVLVGYFVVIVSPSLHSKGNLVVSADVIFLSKPYRKGLTGYKLFVFSQDCLKADGHKTLQVTTTERNPIDKFMLRLGYSKTETKFEKVL